MTASGEPIAHVAELWRYPVKSMRGEQVNTLEIEPRGIVNDRRFALLSSGAPAGSPMLTSRERAALLQYRAEVIESRTFVTTPAAERFHVADPALLRYIKAHLPQGHRIRLEQDPDKTPYTDVRPIAIASTQTFAALNQSLGRAVNPRRFRANLVLTFAGHGLEQVGGGSFPEDALAGRQVALGSDCRLRLLERIPRCRVVTLDPDTTEPDPALMKHLDRHYGGRLGVYAAVLTTGTVRQGDSVRVVG